MGEINKMKFRVEYATPQQKKFLQLMKAVDPTISRASWLTTYETWTITTTSELTDEYIERTSKLIAEALINEDCECYKVTYYQAM